MTMIFLPKYIESFLRKYLIISLRSLDVGTKNLAVTNYYLSLLLDLICLLFDVDVRV